METNASDYTLAIILSIVNEENEVYLVTFHFYTFTAAELNYDTYDKKNYLPFLKALKFGDIIWKA